MGDIADYMIDQMIEQGMWGRSHSKFPAPRSITCERCGKRGLEWGNDGRRWYLIERDITPHQCDMGKAVDDFEVLP